MSVSRNNNQGNPSPIAPPSERASSSTAFKGAVAFAAESTEELQTIDSTGIKRERRRLMAPMNLLTGSNQASSSLSDSSSAATTPDTDECFSTKGVFNRDKIEKGVQRFLSQTRTLDNRIKQNLDFAMLYQELALCLTLSEQDQAIFKNDSDEYERDRQEALTSLNQTQTSITDAIKHSDHLIKELKDQLESSFKQANKNSLEQANKLKLDIQHRTDEKRYLQSLLELSETLYQEQLVSYQGIHKNNLAALSTLRFFSKWNTTELTNSFARLQSKERCYELVEAYIKESNHCLLQLYDAVAQNAEIIKNCHIKAKKCKKNDLEKNRQLKLARNMLRTTENYKIAISKVNQDYRNIVACYYARIENLPNESSKDISSNLSSLVDKPPSPPSSSAMRADSEKSQTDPDAEQDKDTGDQPRESEFSFGSLHESDFMFPSVIQEIDSRRSSMSVSSSAHKSQRRVSFFLPSEPSQKKTEPKRKERSVSFHLETSKRKSGTKISPLTQDTTPPSESDSDTDTDLPSQTASVERKGSSALNVDQDPAKASSQTGARGRSQSFRQGGLGSKSSWYGQSSRARSSSVRHGEVRLRSDPLHKKGAGSRSHSLTAASTSSRSEPLGAVGGSPELDQAGAARSRVESFSRASIRASAVRTGVARASSIRSDTEPAGATGGSSELEQAGSIRSRTTSISQRGRRIRSQSMREESAAKSQAGADKSSSTRRGSAGAAAITPQASLISGQSLRSRSGSVQQRFVRLRSDSLHKRKPASKAHSTDTGLTRTRADSVGHRATRVRSHSVHAKATSSKGTSFYASTSSRARAGSMAKRAETVKTRVSEDTSIYQRSRSLSMRLRKKVPKEDPTDKSRPSIAALSFAAGLAKAAGETPQSMALLKPEEEDLITRKMIQGRRLVRARRQHMLRRSVTQANALGVSSMAEEQAGPSRPRFYFHRPSTKRPPVYIGKISAKGDEVKAGDGDEGAFKVLTHKNKNAVGFSLKQPITRGSFKYNELRSGNHQAHMFMRCKHIFPTFGIDEGTMLARNAGDRDGFSVVKKKEGVRVSAFRPLLMEIEQFNEEGIYFTDMKPQNLMIKGEGRDCRVNLIDVDDSTFVGSIERDKWTPKSVYTHSYFPTGLLGFYLNRNRMNPNHVVKALHLQNAFSMLMSMFFMSEEHAAVLRSGRTFDDRAVYSRTLFNFIRRIAKPECFATLKNFVETLLNPMSPTYLLLRDPFYLSDMINWDGID